MTDAFSQIPTTIPDADGRLTRHNAEAEPYRAYIMEAAGIAGVPPSVIVAIGSRESGWGLLLTPPGCEGTGDGGHGRGLMQIDDRWHKQFIDSGQWKDPRSNIVYGARVLHDSIVSIRRQFPRLDAFASMAAGIAGYNCGAGNVIESLNEGASADKRTAGGDYSKDVLNRAGWFQKKGWA